MIAPREISAWSADKKGGALSPRSFPIRDLLPYEVLVQVTACGVCHSDIHLIDDDWGISEFPLVPGHEILGRVVARGRDAVIKEDAFVGIGWQRSACFECNDCVSANDNLCEVNRLTTCVGHFGGYADFHITDSRYAFEMPQELRDPKFAPLLCGGATVFTPLSEFIDPKQRSANVGVVGLGGLGHLAVTLAAAMGYGVTVFSSTRAKEEEARMLGATRFVDSKSGPAIEGAGRSLDLLIVTANVDLQWPEYLKTLRSDGTLCFVGLPPKDLQFSVSDLMNKRLRVTASPIASRSRMRQMLEFSARHAIAPMTETFTMSKVNDVLGRVRSNSIRYRAVLTVG